MYRTLKKGERNMQNVCAPVQFEWFPLAALGFAFALPICLADYRSTIHGLLIAASQAPSQVISGLAFWASFASSWSYAVLLYCSLTSEKNSSGLCSVPPKEVHGFFSVYPISQTQRPYRMLRKAFCRLQSSIGLEITRCAVRVLSYNKVKARNQAPVFLLQSSE